MPMPVSKEELRERYYAGLVPLNAVYYYLLSNYGMKAAEVEKFLGFTTI